MVCLVIFITTHTLIIQVYGDGANSAVTLAKMAIPTLIGRYNAETGVPELLSIGSGLNKTSGVLKASIVNNLIADDTDKALSAAQGKALNTNKADKATITTDSSDTSPEVTLADNNEYIYSNAAITDLDITLPSGLSAGFIASVVVKIPASAPTISIINTGSYTIATKGDGTWASLVLTPTCSKTVTMIFNYDGINMNVYVSEV